MGMSFRFVVIALVLYYLQRRCKGQGNFRILDFSIPVYDNPPVGKNRRTEDQHLINQRYLNFDYIILTQL